MVDWLVLCHFERGNLNREHAIDCIVDKPIVLQCISLIDD